MHGILRANVPHPATRRDLRQLLRLARELDSITLPSDAADLADAIRRRRTGTAYVVDSSLWRRQR